MTWHLRNSVAIRARNFCVCPAYQISIRGPRVKPPSTSVIQFIYLLLSFVGTIHNYLLKNLSEVCSIVLILFFQKTSEGTASR
jgi:hypothetical protein